MSKVCRACECSKPLSSFAMARNCSDGRATICKPCAVIAYKAYRRSPEGCMRIIYQAQKSSSRKRGHPLPTYSADELVVWALQNGFSKLMADWEASGFSKNLSPSPDRLNDAKGYSLDNLRLVTWEVNRSKAHKDRKNNILITSQNKKVHQLSKTGEYINTFESIEFAARHVKADAANILKVCQGLKYHHTIGGFRWVFA